MTKRTVSSIAFALVMSACLFGLAKRAAMAKPLQWHDRGHYREARVNRPLGQAYELAKRLANGSLAEAGDTFYNSLEAPVFDKFPLLNLIKKHALAKGAEAALMCGSGSTIFAICPDAATAQSIGKTTEAEFGRQSLVRVVPLPGKFTTDSA